MGPRVMADPRHHGGFNQNLFGGLEHLDYFYIQLGMSSSKLTNSYFSEGLNLFSMIYGIILSIIFFNMIKTTNQNIMIDLVFLGNPMILETPYQWWDSF